MISIYPLTHFPTPHPPSIHPQIKAQRSPHTVNHQSPKPLQRLRPRAIEPHRLTLNRNRALQLHIKESPVLRRRCQLDAGIVRDVFQRLEYRAAVHDFSSLVRRRRSRDVGVPPDVAMGSFHACDGDGAGARSAGDCDDARHAPGGVVRKSGGRGGRCAVFRSVGIWRLV